MEEAAPPIRQHPVRVEAALVTFKSQPREKSLRRIDIVARENSGKPFLHGAAELADLNFDCVLELTQTVELFLSQRLLVLSRVGEIFFRVSDLLPERVGVQILERNGRLREQDQAAFAGVSEPAAHKHTDMLPRLIIDADDARPH